MLTEPQDAVQVRKLLGEHVLPSAPFASCSVVRAAYLEITNLFASLGLYQESSAAAADEPLTSTSSLLAMEVAINEVYDSAAFGDIEGLQASLLNVLGTDTDTACRMLEIIPTAYRAPPVDTVSALCELYAQVVSAAAAPPEARAAALANLGYLLEWIIQDLQEVEALPTVGQLDRVWTGLQTGEINPTLSCAILEASGAIMAALVCRHYYTEEKVPNLAQRLKGWGAMISDALGVDNVSIYPHL